MKIQYGSVFGNFKWVAESDIPDSLVPMLCALGALQVGQRTPSSTAEKALAKYEKRPTGFKRDSIPFSEENAEILASNLRSMKVETGRNEKDEPIFATIIAEVVVEQYEGSTADVKMTDERNAYARNGAANKLSKLAEKVRFTGEVGDGKAENAPVEFLRAIRAWAKAQVADI